MKLKKFKTSSALLLFSSAVINASLLQSCSKEAIQQQQSKDTKEIQVVDNETEMLKAYYAKMTELPVKEIIYDQKNQTFYYKGTAQLTKERVKEIKALKESK